MKNTFNLKFTKVVATAAVSLCVVIHLGPFISNLQAEGSLNKVNSIGGEFEPLAGQIADAALVECALACAESHLGEKYRWGGRITEALPGLDCLGLLYLAWGPCTDTPWSEYPVDPSKLVGSGLLGVSVSGAAGVLRDELGCDVLQPGDVLYFLLEGYQIEDDPLLTKDNRNYWPWHTGLYLGNQQVIHAQPGGVVRQQLLRRLSWLFIKMNRLIT